MKHKTSQLSIMKSDQQVFVKIKTLRSDTVPIIHISLKEICKNTTWKEVLLDGSINVR